MMTSAYLDATIASSRTSVETQKDRSDVIGLELRQQRQRPQPPPPRQQQQSARNHKPFIRQPLFILSNRIGTLWDRRRYRIASASSTINDMDRARRDFIEVDKALALMSMSALRVIRADAINDASIRMDRSSARICYSVRPGIRPMMPARSATVGYWACFVYLGDFWWTLGAPEWSQSRFSHISYVLDFIPNAFRCGKREASE